MPSAKLGQPQVRLTEVRPGIDGGKTPVKRTIGDLVQVSCVVVTTSPNIAGALVRFRGPRRRVWRQTRLTADPDNVDRFIGEFEVDVIGRWEFCIEGWQDDAATWRNGLQRRLAGGQKDFKNELADAKRRFSEVFSGVDEALASTFEARSATLRSATSYIDVDPMLAQFGTWYELFPRSFGGFNGVRKVLPELASLGVDVVYLPPIHPIGHTHRKGANNALSTASGDPGSPWAIGDASGGHTAVHRELGSLKDFDRLIGAARDLEIEIALDLAFQCSPDHPWLKEHPEWFSWHADGTIQFAENPPKRYEDIVNFNFDSTQSESLFEALLGVVRFWVGHGVRVFRVDNPHTKPLALWEWILAQLRVSDPEVIFLAEAFTRPAMMHALAKVGFDQSYTYFTWRNTKQELTDYLHELSGTSHEYFRPNFFVNTPDILSHYLQDAGPAGFRARLIAAATLSPSYGMYSGYEHFERLPAHPGSEEYVDSEKYEIKHRKLDGPLLPLFQKVNEIRRSSALFEQLHNVRFLPTANDHLLGYTKYAADADECFVICINLDPRRTNEGLIELPPDIGLTSRRTVVDVLHDRSYTWGPGGNYILLEPGEAHIMRIARVSP